MNDCMNDRTVLFMGDSISDDGRFIALIDLALRRSGGGVRIVNAGVSSETVSGLSEPDHPFPRPCALGRIDRALDLAAPDWVVVLYGINDGIYHPHAEERARAYMDGMGEMVRRIHAHGARVALLTPTVFEGRGVPLGAGSFSYMMPYERYADVMDRYAELIRGFRYAERVIEVHEPLRLAQQEGPVTQDGIHPTLRGHMVMARQLLRELFGLTDAETDAAWAGERLVNAALACNAGEHFRWKELIGHDNPNKSVPPDEAELAGLRDEYTAALAECGRA